MKSLLASFLPGLFAFGLASAAELRVGTFDLDATPPVGSPLAYVKMISYDQPLRCRGIVLTGAGDPVVLCAVDWLGVANEGQDRFKEALAHAADTSPDRVAVHSLHQHDAPRCDFSAAAILKEFGKDHELFNTNFALKVIKDTGRAVAAAISNSQAITHIGFGTSEVERVASNRRILGTDGTVRATRYTTCRDPKLRAEPVGVVDNQVRLLTFFQGEKPLVVLSWFACHPQSFYRTGVANPDFPGIARILREAKTDEVMHLHFAGAGGNIGAGKWNDGQRRYRIILAQRLADGMAAAWDGLERHPVQPGSVAWRSEPVRLPVGEHLAEDSLTEKLRRADKALDYVTYSKHLAWLRRHEAGREITLGCLDFGAGAVLFMPGELFVEFQLAAVEMRPDDWVAMAAYGEYGCGYIGTRISYESTLR